MNIPDKAVEAAWWAMPLESHVDSQEHVRAMLEAAVPHLVAGRNAMAMIIREHWVENWDHPNYPTAVRCMKEDCRWEGRFPGDIAEHCADLIAAWAPHAV